MILSRILIFSHSDFFFLRDSFVPFIIGYRLTEYTIICSWYYVHLGVRIIDTDTYLVQYSKIFGVSLTYTLEVYVHRANAIVMDFYSQDVKILVKLAQVQVRYTWQRNNIYVSIGRYILNYFERNSRELLCSVAENYDDNDLVYVKIHAQNDRCLIS